MSSDRDGVEGLVALKVAVEDWISAGIMFIGRCVRKNPENWIKRKAKGERSARKVEPTAKVELIKGLIQKDVLVYVLYKCRETR